MLETSKDALFMVLSLCILLVTIFICWVIYYVATIFREAKKAILDIRKKIELVEGLIKAAKEKLENTSSYVKLAVEGIETALHFIKARKEEEQHHPKKKK